MTTADNKTYASFDAPPTDGVAVTKSDSVDVVGGPFRCLYVGGAGDVAVVMLSGTVLTFVAVPAGSILPVRGSRVNSTNTSATSIVALW